MTNIQDYCKQKGQPTFKCSLLYDNQLLEILKL